MHRGLSLYLDMIRVAAALEVFVYHLIMLTNPLGYEPRWAWFGHEAVVVFFVLSGFVISYAASVRDKTVSRYIVSRLTRIYPVAIAALLATVALDHFGLPLAPAVYDGFAPLHSSLLRFGISLFLLNEMWVSVQAFSDGPLWSVCYEMIYYIIFATYFYFDNRLRRILLTGSLFLAGIRTLLLLPVWVIGSLAFFETRSRGWRPFVHWIMFLLPLPALWVYTVWPLAGITVRLAVQWFGWTNASMDLGHSRQFLSDNLLGIVLAFHFLGAKNLGPILERGLLWAAPALRFCANCTFTLYVIHLPILLFLSAALGVGNPWLTPAIIVTVSLATVLLAYGVERQRHRLKHLVERCLRGALPA